MDDLQNMLQGLKLVGRGRLYVLQKQKSERDLFPVKAADFPFL
jgi:hypothetical protein